MYDFQLVQPTTWHWRWRICRIEKYTPPLVVLATAVFVTTIAGLSCRFASFLDNWKDAACYNSMAAVSIGLLLVILLSTVLVAVSQAIFLAPYHADLFAQIILIERLAQQKLKIDTKAIRRKFQRRLFIIIIYILPFTYSFIAKSPSWNNLLVIGSIFIMRIFSLIPLFHILFYIDLFDHMFRSFIRYVDFFVLTVRKKTDFCIRDVNQIIYELIYYKQLHFTLWEMSQIINKLFGWVVIILYTQYFVYTIANAYFACILALSGANFQEFIRKL